MRRSVYLAGSSLLVIVISAIAPAQEPSASDEEQLSVKYARASLKLAQVELKQALEMNATFPNLAGFVVERLRANARAAEDQLQLALKPGKSLEEVQLRYAESRAEGAQLRYEVAKKLKQKNPDAVPNLELQRLRLTAQVAKLRSEMWRRGEYQPAFSYQSQWQIDMLSDEIIELRKRIERLENRNVR